MSREVRQRGNNEYSSISDQNDEENINFSENIGIRRNMIAFWLLGLCNNFAYVIMLSSAKDLLGGDTEPSMNNHSTTCRTELITRDCVPMSTGSVLLADIIPALITKISAPFYIHQIPFGMRHIVVIMLQASSFLVVGFSSTIPTALFGVVLASFASGLGEVSYLSLASHFNSRVVSSWSSGTGGAGIIGALTYAILTEDSFLALSPRTALLSMLIVPVLFAYTYWCLLIFPGSVHKISLFEPNSYCVPYTSTPIDSTSQPLIDEDDDDSNSEQRCRDIVHIHHTSIMDKITMMRPLLPFMIPLVLVYFGEYFINQGLFELLEFDCSHGFNMSPDSQYRWYQVVYQLGVFISRSSSDLLPISPSFLPLLALLQLLNAGLFLCDSIYHFVPHIFLLMILVLYEGLLGGASYVNTFKNLHHQIAPHEREFSMCVVSISDTLGIVVAGVASIPTHNYICSLPY